MKASTIKSINKGFNYDGMYIKYTDLNGDNILIET